MKSLAGYSEPGGSFPQYVSFVLNDNEEDVTITVREPAFQGGEGNHLTNGNTASMTMPVGAFWCLWRESMRALGDRLPAIEQR